MQGKGVRIWFSSSIEAHVMESHLLAAQKQAAMLLMNASQQHLIRIAIQNFLLSLTAPQALMTAHVVIIAMLAACIVVPGFASDKAVYTPSLSLCCLHHADMAAIDNVCSVC